MKESLYVAWASFRNDEVRHIDIAHLTLSMVGCLFVFRFNCPVNNLSAMFGMSHRFQVIIQYPGQFACLFEGYTALPRLEIESRIFPTMSLRSLPITFKHE